MQSDPFSSVPDIERHLEEISRSPGAPESLVSAVRYSLLEGGKRLRPVLSWCACEACGAPPARSLTAGAAVELVHAFSLVHDDLPAIDNDDVRRGRATLHRHAGEAMAILAGDAMLCSAFELLAFAELPGQGAGEAGGGVAALRVALLRELSAATTAMIRGQVWDTAGGVGKDLSPKEQLRAIHSNKTGALIRAACRMGALCALGPVEDSHPQLAAIGAYASAVGLMYQIVDDLIDVEQAPEHAGKGTGKDVQAGKLTYPAVYGVEGSRSEISRLLGEARGTIAPLGEKARSLAGLAEYLAKRTR